MNSPAQYTNRANTTATTMPAKGTSPRKRKIRANIVQLMACHPYAHIAAPTMPPTIAWLDERREAPEPTSPCSRSALPERRTPKPPAHAAVNASTARISRSCTSVRETACPKRKTPAISQAATNSSALNGSIVRVVTTIATRPPPLVKPLVMPKATAKSTIKMNKAKIASS